MLDFIHENFNNYHFITYINELSRSLIYIEFDSLLVDTSKTGSSGMFVNPQMSLMLLNEIQMALHQDEDGDL